MHRNSHEKAAAFARMPPAFSKRRLDAASAVWHLRSFRRRPKTLVPACAGMTKQADASCCDIRKWIRHFGRTHEVGVPGICFFKQKSDHPHGFGRLG
ncbi:MAG: hypothetical protein ACTHJP_03075 [Rhodanobacteraceae bacterium]